MKFQQNKRIGCLWLSTLRASTEKFSFCSPFLAFIFSNSIFRQQPADSSLQGNSFENKKAAAVFPSQSQALNKIFCNARGCSSSNMFFTLRYASTKVCNFNSKKHDDIIFWGKLSISGGAPHIRPPKWLRLSDGRKFWFNSGSYRVWERMKSSFSQKMDRVLAVVKCRRFLSSMDVV